MSTNETAMYFIPRLLGAREAAHYLGVSPATLRGLDLPRKRQAGRTLYDRRDLDAYADALPYDGEQVSPAANSCDEAFGCGG